MKMLRVLRSGGGGQGNGVAVARGYALEEVPRDSGGRYLRVRHTGASENPYHMGARLGEMFSG